MRMVSFKITPDEIELVIEAEHPSEAGLMKFCDYQTVTLRYNSGEDDQSQLIGRGVISH